MMKMRKSVMSFQPISSENQQKFFFIIIGEIASTNIPSSKMYLKTIAKLTCLYGPTYLHLDDYPPFSDKSQTFLGHTLTET